MGCHPLRDGYNLTVDHQDSVIAPADVTLDHHSAVPITGSSPCGADTGLAVDTGRDSAALVAIQRLEDDRKADLLCYLDRPFRVAGYCSRGNGKADTLEHALGQILVLSDIGGNDAR